MQRPLDGWWDLVAEVLTRTLPDAGVGYDAAIEKVVVDHGEVTFFVRREHLLEVAGALRDEPELRFEMCMGVSGVHYPHESGRELHAVYHLLSITHGGRRVRLEVVCPDTDPHLPSTISVQEGMAAAPHPLVAGMADRDYYQGKVTKATPEQQAWADARAAELASTEGGTR